MHSVCIQVLWSNRKLMYAVKNALCSHYILRMPNTRDCVGFHGYRSPVIHHAVLSLSAVAANHYVRI